MPLSGKKILCTRPKEGAETFRNILEASGAKVISVPMIEISPVIDLSELDSKLNKLRDYSGIIFTSANGVKFFFERIHQLELKPLIKFFAVGEKTKAAIEEFGFAVEFIPESYDSESLANLLKDTGGEDAKYLFPSGNLSMKKLVTTIDNVDEVVVYETRKPLKKQSLMNLEKMLDEKFIDCIAFFSPSAVSNFAELFPSYKSTGAVIAAIGKTTQERIKELGLDAKIVAPKATAESLGEEIIKYYNAG